MTRISECRPVVRVFTIERPGPNNIGSHNILFWKLSSSWNVNIRSTVRCLALFPPCWWRWPRWGRLSDPPRRSPATPAGPRWHQDNMVLSIIMHMMTWSGGWPAPGAGQRDLHRAPLRQVLRGDGLVCEDLAGQQWGQPDRWHGGHLDSVLSSVRGEGRLKSHLQTDWASYCETRAFRVWDWTVALARLILSPLMWTCAHPGCQWGHCWLSPDQNSDRSNCENIKCPKCGESIMTKPFLTFLTLVTSPLLLFQPSSGDVRLQATKISARVIVSPRLSNIM